MDKNAIKNKFLLREGGKEMWLPPLKTASQRGPMKLKFKYSSPYSILQQSNTSFSGTFLMVKELNKKHLG